MGQRKMGIIVNGATGGLANHQHLPALVAIRKEGGVQLANGDNVGLELLLVARREQELSQVAKTWVAEGWTTDLDTALSSADHQLFFVASATGLRQRVVGRAIEAGKHVYCEKPVATNLADAMALAKAATEAKVCNGVVQDKIFLPGFRKLKRLKDSGYFGRILEARLEFGRWIFDGETQTAQRPSWNYRKRDGGGLVLDMFPHWRYLVEQLVGDIEAVSCTCRTHIPRRRDEQGDRYDVDVEDAAFAQLEIRGGVICSVNNSWCTRIRRDDIIMLQVDGTDGSAVATPHTCFIQSIAETPKPVLTVDRPQPRNFYDDWLVVPDHENVRNSYRTGWEMFIRHVAEGAPFPSPLLEGAKGVQLAELSYQSDQERRWVTVPALS